MAKRKVAAEKQREELYLPPVHEGAIIREFRNGRFIYPAGLEGRHGDLKYVSQEDDGEKAWAYKKKQGAV